MFGYNDPPTNSKSLASQQMARVDASGSDSTGALGDLSRPFFTVQAAIHALEKERARSPIAQQYAVDIGNSPRFENLTTSLNNFALIAASREINLFNSLTFTTVASGSDIDIISGKAGDIIAANSLGITIGLEGAIILGNITNSAGSVQVSCAAQDGAFEGTISAPGFRIDVRDLTGHYQNNVVIDSAGSDVYIVNSIVDDVLNASTLHLEDSRVRGTNNATTTTYADVLIPTVLSKKVVRVDSVYGNDSNGQIDDPGKPFLTIQAALTALEGASVDGALIDVGISNGAEDLTTSLHSIGFRGSNVPSLCNSLTLTGTNHAVGIYCCGIDDYINAPNLSGGGLLNIFQTEGAYIIDVSATGGTILILSEGDSVIQGTISSPANNILLYGNLIHNSNSITIDSAGSTVTVHNARITTVTAAATLNLYDSRVSGTNSASSTVYFDGLLNKSPIPGGTTGQVLSKASNSDWDFAWTTGGAGGSGYSGYSGSGLSGYSGFCGLSGYSGFSSTSGYSGFCGLSGYSGFCGLSGYSGYSGSGYSGFCGLSGYSGFCGLSGYSGFSSTSGYSGFSSTSGYSGYSGVFGGNTQFFNFDTGTSQADPGSGNLRFNNATYSIVSNIYISINNNSGTSVTTWEQSLTKNDVVTIYKQGSQSSIFQTFQVTGPVSSAANYNVIPVSNTFNLGTFSASDPLVVSFSPAGRSGYSGFCGLSGYSGFSSTSGYSGFCGLSGYSGFSSTSGYSGFCGLSGYSGFSGQDGQSGYSGFCGLSGYSGYSGSGLSGYSGFCGLSGTSGYSGYSGPGLAKILWVESDELQEVGGTIINKAGTVTGTAGVGSSLFLQRLMVPALMNVTEIDVVLSIGFPATNQGAGTLSRSMVIYSLGNSTSLASVMSISGTSAWSTGTSTTAGAVSLTQFQGGWSTALIQPMTFAATTLSAGEYVVGQLFNFAQGSSTWTLNFYGVLAQTTFLASAATNLTSATLSAASTIPVAAGSAITGVSSYGAAFLALSTAGSGTAFILSQTVSQAASSFSGAISSGVSVLALSQTNTAKSVSFQLKGESSNSNIISSIGTLAGSHITAAIGTIGAVTNVALGALSSSTLAQTTLPNFGYIGTGSTTSNFPTVFINGIMSTGAIPTAITLTSTAVTYSGSIAFQQPWFALVGS